MSMKILFVDKDLPIINGMNGGVPPRKSDAWITLLNGAKGFVKYITRYGWHFTDELAETASISMKNVNGSDHCWLVSEIEKAYKGVKSKDTTWGDITYLANMAYADFFPKICKTEADCLAYAEAVVNDPDGYPGMPFHRWLADIIGKKVTIDWESYL